jgi:hypothetical protein
MVDNYRNLCLDKKYIISSELDAYEGLSKYTKEQIEKEMIEKEIAELRRTLELLP